MPGLFGDNQSDLLLVARQRNEVPDIAQTVDHFAVMFEREARHGISRFWQVEAYGHKITQSRRKPEPGTSPRRETSQGRSENGTCLQVVYPDYKDARQSESPRRATVCARAASRPPRRQCSPNQFRPAPAPPRPTTRRRAGSRTEIPRRIEESANARPSLCESEPPGLANRDLENILHQSREHLAL